MAGPRLKADRDELRSVDNSGAEDSFYFPLRRFSGYGWLNGTNAPAANNVGTAAHTVCRGA